MRSKRDITLQKCNWPDYVFSKTKLLTYRIYRQYNLFCLGSLNSGRSKNLRL